MTNRISSGRDDLPIKRPVDAEVSEELAFHLERRVEEYVAGGMSPEAARRAALARFGDMHDVERECASLLTAERREAERRNRLAELAQDLRFALRSALRAPLVSVVSVLILALGIGVNTAIFAGVKGVLLDALPYRQPDRLTRIYSRFDDGTLERGALSPATATDVAERQHHFERIAWFVHTTQDVAYSAGSAPEVLTSAFVGGTFFETLGVRAAFGRVLEPRDASTGAPSTVVLSHAAWARLAGADPSAVGRVIRLNNEPHTVVGVLPQGFVGPMGAADVWLPIDISPSLQDPVRARQSRWLGVIGRLATTASLDGARQELRTIAASLAREHPESERGSSMTVEPLRDVMIGETRTPMIVLMASAGLVLIIACANLAGVLLSRAVSRRRELAIRVAIGAGRARLVRQMVTESLLVALAGGALGVAAAGVTLHVVERAARAVLPSHASLSLDAGPLIFASLMALATGLVVGIVPALAATRGLAFGVLREEGRGVSESRSTGRTRGILVAGQIALCISLVSGAGLLLRSLWVMTSAPLGFDAERALTMSVHLVSREYSSEEARMRFFERLDERLRTIPGVTGVGSARELPSASMNRDGLTIEGVVWPAAAGPPFIASTNVSDAYFRTMRIPVRRGRTFGPEDRPGSLPAIVISERMAATYWPRGNAIGARLKLGPIEGASWGEVVGIVGDVRSDPALPAPAPMAYTSSRQRAGRTRAFVLRTAQGVEPFSIVRQVRRELAVLDPTLPLYAVSTLADVVAASTAGRRLPVALLTTFGVVALLLASVGVYAMFTSLAAARARECGVRMALGATRGSIARLVLRDGAAWLMAGVGIGVVGVVAVGRIVRDLLFGIPMFDPATLIGTTGILVVCSATALLLPLRRLTRVDPVSVLR